MKATPLPPTTVITLLRSLGMLFQQAGMYGLNHNVSALAMREAFAQLESALAVYGAIELTKTEQAFLVNGQPVDTRDAVAHGVAQKIENNGLGGIVFKPGLDETEFAIFTKLITASAAHLAQTGGMKKAIDDAGLLTIASSETAYRQISDPPPPPEPEPTERPRHTPETPGVLDLSDSLDLAAAEPTFQPVPATAHEAEIQDRRQKREDNNAKIAAMLRSTATLIENENALPGEIGQQQVLASIERILKLVETSSRETRAHASKLAGQVEADRQTIASIESAARRKGIGFNLTRKELLAHYSEINQEMLQPITVSSGALDLLLSGNGGDLAPSQKELIKLAFESMQRVNQLVEFTNRISGLPNSYTPDDKLIRDSYTNT